MQNTKVDKNLKYILNQVVVYPDGLGDMKTLTSLTKLQRPLLEKINQEHLFHNQYALLPFIYCPEDKYEMIVKFLWQDKLIQKQEDIGKIVHIIKYPKDIAWSTAHRSNFIQHLFDAHKKYTNINQKYGHQIAHIAIINTISTQPEDEYQMINPQNTENFTTLIEEKSGLVVHIRIAEPGWNKNHEAYTHQLNPIQNDHLGFDQKENGILFNEHAPSLEKDKVEILQHLSQNQPWIKLLVDVNHEKDLDRFLSKNYIVPSYNKKARALFFNIKMLAQSPLVQDKEKLTIITNLALSEIKDRFEVKIMPKHSRKLYLISSDEDYKFANLSNCFVLENFNDFLKGKYEEIFLFFYSENEKKHQVNLGEPNNFINIVKEIIKNKDYKNNRLTSEQIKSFKGSYFNQEFNQYPIELIHENEKTILNSEALGINIQIVCGVSVSPSDHEKLFGLSSGIAMCTGDGSFKMTIDKEILPLNDLRIHKINDFNAFIHTIDNPNIKLFYYWQLYLAISAAGKNALDPLEAEIVNYLKQFDVNFKKAFQDNDYAQHLAQFITPNFMEQWKEVVKQIKQSYNYTYKIPHFLKKSILLAELPMLIQQDAKKANLFLIQNFHPDDENHIIDFYAHRKCPYSTNMSEWIHNQFTLERQNAQKRKLTFSSSEITHLLCTIKKLSKYGKKVLLRSENQSFSQQESHATIALAKVLKERVHHFIKNSDGSVFSFERFKQEIRYLLQNQEINVHPNQKNETLPNFFSNIFLYHIPNQKINFFKQSKKESYIKNIENDLNNISSNR